jgi:sulfur carrier protein ThiS adenylyltransferase
MGIFDRNVPGSTEILQARTVGIAGCGGLGSNAAISLTRAGVGGLILADFDTVEESNLNRQAYFVDDIGRLKVEALAATLRRINPAIRLALHCDRLDPFTVAEVFAGADLLLEAFDRAESKQWLIEAWSRAYPDRFVVAASGVSGLGATERLGVRRAGHIVVCGDQTSDMSEGLCAPRVAIAANMQANVAVELLGELERTWRPDAHHQ